MRPTNVYLFSISIEFFLYLRWNLSKQGGIDKFKNDFDFVNLSEQHVPFVLFFLDKRHIAIFLLLFSKKHYKCFLKLYVDDIFQYSS